MASRYEQLVKALRRCDMKQGCFNANCRYSVGKYFCDMDKVHKDAAAAIETLQAEVKRLKECNDELREAQTYIDHYGDKWMTSAKDVPTAAYNHGYMDGKNEAEQALEPKRGEWIEADGFYKCSVCGELECCRGKYCPDCGAKMREVQE